MTLALATVTLSGPAVADTSPIGPPQTFFFQGTPAGLVLSPRAPSANESTTWTKSGEYSTTSGLLVRIPIENPVPELLVDESGGVDGTVTWSFKQQPATALPFVSYGNYGTFSWYLIEGARSARMTEPCTKYNSTSYKYEPCQGRHGRYNAEFPGHAGAGTPHSHGEGTQLNASDFSWLLEYRVAPCNGLTCVPGYTMKYSLSIVVDGTTFVHYDARAPPREEPAEAAEAEDPCHHEGGGNETQAPDGSGNETGNSEGPAGNETSNETASQPAGASGAQDFRVRDARGTAPGVPVFGIVVAGLAAAWMRRRNHA